MADQEPRKKRLGSQIEDKIKQAAHDILESLQDLVSPSPQLVPVPATAPARRRRR